MQLLTRLLNVLLYSSVLDICSHHWPPISISGLAESAICSQSWPVLVNSSMWYVHGGTQEASGKGN